MRIPNDLNFDTETYLLFSIYYEALQVVDYDQSAKKCLERFQKQIRAVGHVLEWLYLADPDKESPLGWKPSHTMMGLIVQPRRRWLKSRKDDPSAQDEDTFDTMIEDALAKVGYHSSIRRNVISVLGVLGLVKYVSSGEGVPTNLLRELVAERRREERIRREELSFHDDE